MKIAFAVLMIFSLTALSNPRDDEDLEEQEKYLEEWREKKWKDKKR